jgi:hypothetical protein
VRVCPCSERQKEYQFLKVVVEAVPLGSIFTVPDICCALAIAVQPSPRERSKDFITPDNLILLFFILNFL